MNSKLKIQNSNRHGLSAGVTHDLAKVDAGTAASPSPGGEGRGEGELNSKFKIQNSKLPSLAGFTLVELLIVIATIGILAAFLIPVFTTVTKHAVIQRAQSERDQLETAIESYHSYYGFYPPCNTNATPTILAPALTNQLYFELEGTTTNVVGGVLSFTTLDNANTIPAATTVPATFGVSGFMNYSKGSAEDSKPAKDFLQSLSAAHMATNGAGVCVLVTAASSDSSYNPLPGFTSLAGRTANPWRYLYPGVNNPNSYDLWVQIFVGGKTNLICNWKTDPQINSSLP